MSDYILLKGVDADGSADPSNTMTIWGHTIDTSSIIPDIISGLAILIIVCVAEYFWGCCCRRGQPNVEPKTSHMEPL